MNTITWSWLVAVYIHGFIGYTIAIVPYGR